jgi:NitT/TauT family transport system substrate-binding protein
MRLHRATALAKLVPLILASALVAACGGTAESSSNSGDDAGSTELRIGTLKIAALTNLYAADKLGYFADQGLTVEFTQMGGGAELLPAVSAGKIDMALSIPSSAIQAREGGFDFKMVMQNEVAASEAPDSQAVFVRADSKVSRVADLKGKRIAVNNIGSQMWLSMVEVLDRAGVDQDDVQFLEMPFPNMREALANDQVDAVFNVEPFTSDMAASGDFQAISYAATEALPGQPVGAFWATTQWYEENEQAAEKFVAAMDEVNTYLASHPDETNQLISEYTGIDLPVIEKMTPINWDSEVDRSTVQELLDLMRERGLLSKPVEAESVLFPLATQ